MESNQSGYNYSPLITRFHSIINNNRINPSKISTSSSSSSSSGFSSSSSSDYDDVFKTASEVGNLGNGIGGEDEDDVAASRVFVKMPVAVVTGEYDDDDDVEKDEEARILRVGSGSGFVKPAVGPVSSFLVVGGEIPKLDIDDVEKEEEVRVWVVGAGSGSVGDGVRLLSGEDPSFGVVGGEIPKLDIDDVEKEDEARVFVVGVGSGSVEDVVGSVSSGGSSLGGVGDETVEVSVGRNGDKEGEIPKMDGDEYVEKDGDFRFSSVGEVLGFVGPVSSEHSSLNVIGEEGGIVKSAIDEGSVVNLKGDKVETMKSEVPVTVVEAEKDLETVEVEPVDVTSGGDSVVRSIRVDMVEPRVAVVGRGEVSSESPETEMDYVDEKPKVEVLESGDTNVGQGDVVKETKHDDVESSGEINGQIVTDSEEVVDTDGELDEKQVFDPAAFAALLESAIGGGGGSDGGNIVITSRDRSRLSSIERPDGLGPSVRSAQPLGQAHRSDIFAHSSVENEKELSEEEKKKLEMLQKLRVKFLRLVRRLGASLKDSVVAKVLYRLALVAGRPNNQYFSFDTAMRTALELETKVKDDLNFSVNILVLGKCGVGKSSTINSIFGEAKAKIGAFEPGTTTVSEITGVVDGVKIKVIDTPGLKSAATGQAFNLKVLSSVKRFTKKSPPDIVLYVDRLDMQARDLNDLPLLKTILDALGHDIWRNTIVTLTHGASAPPDGFFGNPLNYEDSVSQRFDVVQQSIRHAIGDLLLMSKSLMNPFSLVENHPLCRKNRDGQKVLPNGQTWRSHLLLLCYTMKILAEANLIMKFEDPFDHRKLFGVHLSSPPLPYLLSSMLQTRAHPKLPSDQGINYGDSDVDLADYSDSDNEDEEDEYDQLPPFKPLREAQIDKLSKEQRKAYFAEFDYRVRLLQKKQWKQEVRRAKEMKKRAKGGASEHGFAGTEGVAPVAFPLPDTILPPTFDSDDPAYRYRALEPTSQRAFSDSHCWDHDYSYNGFILEQSLAIARQFPAAFFVQIAKDKKDFSIHLDSSVAAKHGEHGSTMASFDLQNVGKQLAYTVRGETKFKILKKNKTVAGVSVTFLGENVVTGFKVEDQITFGKQWSMVGSVGTVRCRGDAVYGANIELQMRELDYPIGQVQSTYGLSLMKWRNDWVLGINAVAQFLIGRNSKVAIRAGMNNKLNGEITVNTSSSDPLWLVLAGILSIASAIFKKIWPATGDR